MVLPLYADDPLEGQSRAYVTWGLIALNTVVFLAVVTLSDAWQEYLVATLGFTPAVAIREWPFPGPFPRDLTLLSSMFMHANAFHLLGNMLFLWVFGDDIEDAIGHLRFLIFYLVCGIAGALLFLLQDPHSKITLIGASGAISGVLTAFLLLRPCAKIEVFVYFWPFGVRALYVIGLWIAMQVFSIAMQADDGIAYWDHIGGVLAGAFLILFLRPAKLPLFECLWPTKEWDEAHGHTRRWALEHILVLGTMAIAVLAYVSLVEH